MSDAVEAPDDDDTVSCEACGASGPIEQFTSMCDCWFCAACTAQWNATFAACTHRWERVTDDFGEPAAYCERCSGCVALEDFPRLGLDITTVPAPAAAEGDDDDNL